MAILGVTLCSTHGEPAVRIEAGGFGLLVDESWERVRYRCGCSTTDGPAPSEKGDLIRITWPDGSSMRGIVTDATRSTSGESIRLLSDPFDSEGRA